MRLAAEVTRAQLAASPLIWRATGGGYAVFTAVTAALAATSLTPSPRGWILAAALAAASAWHLRAAPPQIGSLANQMSLACLSLCVAFAFFAAQPGGGLAAGGAMFIGPLVALRLQDRRQIAVHLIAASLTFLSVAASGILGSAVDPYTVLSAGFAGLACPVQGFSCTMIFEATERQQAELARLVRRDALTGLGNRRLLQERLADAITRRPHTGFCLLTFDLGGLRLHGDAETQHATESRLRAAAEALATTNTNGDMTLARLDADQFVVLAPSTPPRYAQRLANTINAAIAEHSPSEHSTQLRTGIATYPADAITADVLLHVAEQRLSGPAIAHHH